MHRRPAHFASVNDVLVSLSTNRNSDNATHRVRALGFGENRILQDLASLGVVSGEVSALLLAKMAAGYNSTGAFQNAQALTNDLRFVLSKVGAG
jgi:hypothetical protein